MPCAPQSIPLSIPVHASILMQVGETCFEIRLFRSQNCISCETSSAPRTQVSTKETSLPVNYNILSSYQIQLNPSYKWWWMFTTLGTLSFQWKCLRSLYVCSISFLDWLDYEKWHPFCFHANLVQTMTTWSCCGCFFLNCPHCCAHGSAGEASASARSGLS